jgi:hypothetical protein
MAQYSAMPSAVEAGVVEAQRADAAQIAGSRDETRSALADQADGLGAIVGGGAHLDAFRLGSGQEGRVFFF